MRRTTVRLSAAATTFAAGLAAASLSHAPPALKSIFEEPSVEAPSMYFVEKAHGEIYPEATTTDDFDRFWSEFKSAVAKNDKERLYALVHCNEFSWEPGALDLKYKKFGGIPNYYYVIGSYDDFAQNYSKIFPAFVKRAILNRRPVKGFGYGGYSVGWAEGRGRYRAAYTLMFFDEEGYGYKFAGALMGPAD